jgi:hypothetical protein
MLHQGVYQSAKRHGNWKNTWWEWALGGVCFSESRAGGFGNEWHVCCLSQAAALLALVYGFLHWAC